eukprot:1859057-Pyramimonas_sp.AAC.1
MCTRRPLSFLKPLAHQGQLHPDTAALWEGPSARAGAGPSCAGGPNGLPGRAEYGTPAGHTVLKKCWAASCAW